MNRLQQIALSATMAVIAGVALIQRPARLASVRLTAITPAPQPIAHIALTYSAGTRPVSLVLDLTTPAGSGSVTLDGVTLFCDIPLIASQNGPQRIVATVWHRSLGRTTPIMQQFD